MARGFRSTQSSSSPRSLVLSETPASARGLRPSRDENEVCGAGRRTTHRARSDTRRAARVRVGAARCAAMSRIDLRGRGQPGSVIPRLASRPAAWQASDDRARPARELSPCISRERSPNCERRRAWPNFADLRSACWRSSTSIALPRRRSRGARRTRTCWRSARGVPPLRPRVHRVRHHTSTLGLNSRHAATTLLCKRKDT